MPYVISISGPKGSGKDTAAAIMNKLIPNSSVIAFADPIKEVIMSLFDLATIEQYDLFKRTSVDYNLPGYQTHGVPGRSLVREIGMLMRGYDESQFIKYVKAKIQSDPQKCWIVSDMRFDNEWMALRTMKSKMVKVSRSGYHYDGHITERGFDDSLVDFHAHNDGTLEQFEINIESIVMDIMKEWDYNEAYSGTSV